MGDTSKTYKRETALVLFGVMFAFFLCGIWSEQALKIAELLLTPTFLFGGGAMGLDSYAKQIKRTED